MSRLQSRPLTLSTHPSHLNVWCYTYRKKFVMYKIYYSCTLFSRLWTRCYLTVMLLCKVLCCLLCVIQYRESCIFLISVSFIVQSTTIKILFHILNTYCIDFVFHSYIYRLQTVATLVIDILGNCLWG